MSITDELREYALGWDERNRVHSNLIDIADRIDAEHERLMAGRRRSCVFYDAERNCCKVHDEGDMADFGWMRLPKGADGEYIHIGDVMENIVCPPVHREVTGVGAECFYGWDEGNGRYSQFGANCYRHYHAPTVEDVLMEFMNVMMRTSSKDAASRIADYAAKLRLAGDAE